MLYTTFVAGGEVYKLRINTRNIVELEKKLGCNPIAIFGEGDIVPTVTVMVSILHASLQQFHHNITAAAAYDIFDAWIEDGHNSVEFVSVILDIYRVSGLMPREAKTEETTEKN